MLPQIQYFPIHRQLYNGKIQEIEYIDIQMKILIGFITMLGLK